MSAILQSRASQQTLHPIGESAAIRLISYLSVNAPDLPGSLQAMAETALRVPGLQSIRFVPAAPLPHVGRLEWHAPVPPGPCGSAVATVAANGRTWGRLHLHFEPRIHTVESPLRLARFLGQQVALLIDRFELTRRRDAQAARLERLQKRLETRKAVHRAKGILARLNGVPDQEALAMLLEYARRSRRSLDQLANSIVLGDTSFRRPTVPPRTQATAFLPGLP